MGSGAATKKNVFTVNNYSPGPTSKLEGHPLSVVHYSLFSIFAATIHICRPSPPYVTWVIQLPNRTVRKHNDICLQLKTAGLTSQL